MWNDVLVNNQYPNKYRLLLGARSIGDHDANAVIKLLKEGVLYDGSDGSVKEGCGAHTYIFISGRDKGGVWWEQI